MSASANLMDVQFTEEKSAQLQTADLSRNGSIDEPIVDIITWLNGHEAFFSTSSCSGRVLSYATSGVATPECRFLRVFHSPLSPADVEDTCATIREACESSSPGTKVVFKCEPFILHVRAKDFRLANALCKTGIECGFRNSGITFGRNGRILVALRSSHTMEVPVGANGSLLVSSDYLRFLCEEGNARLAENFARIMKFQHALLDEKFSFFVEEEDRPVKAGRRPEDLPQPVPVADKCNAAQEEVDFSDFVEGFFEGDS